MLSGDVWKPVPIIFATSVKVGAIGGTSLLVIQPDTGVVVAAMVNMSNVNLDLVQQIISLFGEQSQNCTRRDFIPVIRMSGRLCRDSESAFEITTNSIQC